MNSDIFSAIIMVGKFVLALGQSYIIEAPVTRNLPAPCTFPYGLTTAIGLNMAPFYRYLQVGQILNCPHSDVMPI